MKIKLIGMLSILASLVAVAPAQARSPMPTTWGAKLSQFAVDPQLPYHDLVSGASVKIDYDKDLATLTVYRRFHCPPGKYCAQMMPAPVLVTLPVVAHETDACGSRVITARKDLRRVDGALEELSIRDNTKLWCKILLPATQVEYRSEYNGRGGALSTRSTFSGEALRPVYDQR